MCMLMTPKFLSCLGHMSNLPTQHVYLASRHHKCNIIKLLKFQIFGPTSAPSLPTVSCTSDSLPFFLLSKPKPLEQYLPPFFLSHSLPNMLGDDGGSIFKTQLSLLPPFFVLPSSLTWILSYTFKICQILLYFHFTQVRSLSPENGQYGSHVLLPSSPF